jgi:hypothetical protein
VAIGVGLVVAWPDFSTTSFRLLFGAVVLIVYAAYRTWRPIPYTDDRSTAPALLFEFALATGVVLLTGAWSSPFTFSLLPAAMLAGFSRGSVFAARLTVVCAVIVSAQHLLIDAASVSDGVRDCAAWLAVTSFVAVTSGVARQVSRESARQQSLALDRLGRLAEANALLFSLHRVAQTLPASLDLDEVLDSSMSRLRDLVEFDSVTVLLYEESDGSWVPVRRKGNRDQPTLDAETLPEALQRALLARGTVHEPDLTKSPGRRRAPPRASTARCGRAAPRSGSSPSSPTSPTATAPRTSSCSTGWWNRSASPSTMPAGSPASARSAPTRSAAASPGTSTTRSANPWPTWASNWTVRFASPSAASSSRC